MIQTPEGGATGPGPGSPGRGVLLIAAALLVGIGVLAKAAPSTHNVAATAAVSAGTAAATTTTTALPASGLTPVTNTPPASVPSTTTTTAAAASHGTPTTTLATHSPASVKVIVANGTSTPGVAGKLKSKLAAAGYNVLAPENTTSTAKASAVYYAAGYQGDGQAVAGDSGLSSSAAQPMSNGTPVPNASSAQVVVVIGPDLATSLSAGH